MKDYKVGDKVWDIANKSFAIFKKLSEEHSMDTLAVIERDNEKQHYPIRLLHQSADSMFEELGFSKSTNSAYAKYHKHNIKITFVDYNGKMVLGVPAIVTPQLHQAIHQKLIELGWIE